jgi:chromosome segregation ATPase
MTTLSNQLAQFQQKLMRVMKQYDVLHRENARLKKELAKKDVLLSNKEALLKDLEEKLAALRLSKGSFSDEEKKQLGKKINTYVKEIDKCLTLLNAMPKK